LIKENFQLPVEGGGGPALGPELVHGEQILDVVIEELLEQLLSGVAVLLSPLLSRLSVYVTSLDKERNVINVQVKKILPRISIAEP
jgi:hypothetical protein